jgi:SAM-dependent methyltransferase
MDLIEHYGRDGGVADSILAAVEAAGVPLDPPVPREAFAGVDEFHLGGAAATAAALEALTLGPDDRVLDVGCGVGGPARAIAALARCSVTGVDLTPSFIEAATRLSELTGLHDATNFRVADASRLDDPDGSYTAATMFHVGMNLPDKTAVFTELRRVLRPGGRLLVYEVMRTAPGELAFPQPWSSVSEASHVATPEEYDGALTAAGFAVGPPVDRRELVMTVLQQARANPVPVNLTDLMGPAFPDMFGNLLAALSSGIVSPIQLVGST